jgi:hypothetical protein
MRVLENEPTFYSEQIVARMHAAVQQFGGLRFDLIQKLIGCVPGSVTRFTPAGKLPVCPKYQIGKTWQRVFYVLDCRQFINLLSGGIMRIGIPAESRPGETRVAATPETVKKMAAKHRCWCSPAPACMLP